MSEIGQRPKLPDDEHGRSWVIAIPTANEAHPEKGVIATLIAADDDLQIHVLGTAFVVSTSGDKALCMCAAHSLEQAKIFDDARRPGSTWKPPPDLELPLPRYWTPDRIKAVFLIEDKAVTCNVEQLNYIQSNDIALITVVAPHGRQVFNDRVALNFAVPQIGTKVVVLANDITITNQREQYFQITLGTHMRHGIVTDIAFGKALPGQSSVFYTTIPVPGGMSGAPVLACPTLNSPITVCGIVSSDLSPPEAYKSFQVPGRSAMSMLWPSYGLGINAMEEDSVVPRYFSVADLVRLNFLNDRTSEARLSVQQSRQMTRILYEDAVHGRILLQTTGHPNAG